MHEPDLRIRNEIYSSFVRTGNAPTPSETARALEAIEGHARKFPKGQLLEERDSLWVQALVNAGKFDEARLRAAEFRASFPDSMLLPAVEAALASIPK